MICTFLGTTFLLAGFFSPGAQVGLNVGFSAATLKGVPTLPVQAVVLLISYARGG
jgi:hypothetical protein